MSTWIIVLIVLAVVVGVLALAIRIVKQYEKGVAVPVREAGRRP